jgi:hypothetical protein
VADSGNPGVRLRHCLKNTSSLSLLPRSQILLKQDLYMAEQIPLD